jgi:rhodanese-related sulfurtransferase
VSVEAFLEDARAEINRVTPQQADELRRTGALIIDIRPHHNRLAEGEITDSVVVERIVLEWRLDPTGEWRLPGFTADTPVVVVCNEGYSSSLAARDLKRIGVKHATDLIGGYRAWRSAGLPIREGGSQAVT